MSPQRPHWALQPGGGQVGMGEEKGAVHWLCLLPALPKNRKETNSKFNDDGGGGGVVMGL